jgi:hypothetical protein
VCVQTRDLEVTSRLVTDSGCRQTIRSLIGGPGATVLLDGERMKLQGPRSELGLEPDVEQVLGLLDQLASLVRVLADFTRGHEVHAAPKHDSAKVIAWTSVLALFLLGGVGLILATVHMPLLHPDRFLWMNLGLGLVGVPFAAFGLAHLVSRRTVPGRLLLPLVLLTLFALPLASTAAAYLANGLLDEGAPTFHAEPITHTHTYKQKSNRRYQVGFDAWWQPGEVRWLHTDRSTYEAVRAGGDWHMELAIRPGWLGQPWIEQSVIVQDGG